MVSATSSRWHNAVTPAALGVAIERRSDPVWVLSARTDTFARTAWERGRRVAYALERRVAGNLRALADEILRDGDAFVHAPGADLFGFALLDERAPKNDNSGDRRGALASIERSVHEIAGVEVYTGWTQVSAGSDVPTALAGAAERGRATLQRRAFAELLHDLTTPISAIYGTLVAATEDVVPPETSRRFLEAARGEALRAGRLVRGFLSAHADERFAACDAFEALETAVNALLPVAQARGASVEMCPLCERAAVNMSDDRTVSIVVSLIENAIKHGKRDGRVRASVHVDGDFASIEVEDDGPGVADGAHERIFQFGARAGDAEGFGIGLAHARLLAVSAGGEIRVARSSLGGARFSLRLPLLAGTRTRVPAYEPMPGSLSETSIS